MQTMHLGIVSGNVTVKACCSLGYVAKWRVNLCYIEKSAAAMSANLVSFLRRIGELMVKQKEAGVLGKTGGDVRGAPRVKSPGRMRTR
jgi:hypothetical protein